MTAAPPALVVMGVSGSGKTTVAVPLASRLVWPFQEGDDLHPPANIAKMAAGVTLNDADRGPWLAAIGEWIDARALAAEPGVVTCSALKLAYRDQLRRGRPQVVIVYLEGSPAVIAARLALRHGHFMPPSQLDSQFATLEAPTAEEGAIIVDIDQPPAAQVSQIIAALASRGLA